MTKLTTAVAEGLRKAPLPLEIAKRRICCCRDEDDWQPVPHHCQPWCNSASGQAMRRADTWLSAQSITSMKLEAGEHSQLLCTRQHRPWRPPEASDISPPAARLWRAIGKGRAASCDTHSESLPLTSVVGRTTCGVGTRTCQSTAGQASRLYVDK